MSIDHVVEPCLWPARLPVCVCARLMKSVTAFHSCIRRTPPESVANAEAEPNYAALGRK